MNKPKHAIYRYFDVNNILLYIGISHCPFTRYSAHKNLAEWFNERVANMKIEWIEDKSTAEKLEMAYIETEKPLYNRRIKDTHSDTELFNLAIDLHASGVPRESIYRMLCKLNKDSDITKRFR